MSAGRDEFPADMLPPAPARKNPRLWLFIAVGVAFLLLGTGSVFAGVAVANDTAPVAAPRKTATPKPPVPETRTVPAQLAAATRLRTCSIATQALDSNLLTFQASVINATTGEVLFDRAGATPSRTASVLKTLTAAAALSVLGPNHRISTSVYEGSAPGTVVLVGGGDPTLSALANGQASVYQDAPKLLDLADQVKAKWLEIHPDSPITSVVLDSSLWSPDDRWDSSWERSEQTEGYQAEVTALMIDGGRANPQRQNSPRSSTGIQDAGNAFASFLGLTSSERTSIGTAASGATLLGVVKSQPLKTLIAQMLPASDNVLAEMLARVTSKAAGGDGSAASLATVIPAALANYNLVTTGVTIRDGSGLSNDNAVSASFVAQLMAKVAGGQQNLDVIYGALPIAGRTGTLANRFTGSNAAARGAIVAKTGWIKTEYSLAGVVNSADGTQLAFAFYALGEINSRTQAALDTVAAAVFACGNNLSNN